MGLLEYSYLDMKKRTNCPSLAPIVQKKVSLWCHKGHCYLSSPLTRTRCFLCPPRPPSSFHSSSASTKHNFFLAGGCKQMAKNYVLASLLGHCEIHLVSHALQSFIVKINPLVWSWVRGRERGCVGRGDPGWSPLHNSEDLVSLSRSSGGEQLRRSAEASEEVFLFRPEVFIQVFFFPSDNMLELRLAVLLGEFHSCYSYSVPLWMTQLSLI